MKTVPKLSSEFLIDEKYRVTFFLKKGSYAESYRVKNPEGNTKYLKLFSYSKLHKTQFNEEGDILEIEILKSINHPNLVKFEKEGILILEGQKYAYCILDFISGETLADKMRREESLNPYEAKTIILGVLNGLNHLHNLEIPVIHNEITNLNVMLDLSGKIPIPKIIDFGYARYLNQSNKEFLKEGLNPFLLAPETLNKVFSTKSDIFAVGALYYQLLFGLPPWFVEISNYRTNSDSVEEAILTERKRPLRFLDSSTGIQKDTFDIITKALHPEAEKRFNSVKEFIQALNGEIEVSPEVQTVKMNKPPYEPEKGKGFESIAGMEDLKSLIKLDVIDALNEKEKYAKYGLTIPNGMLLYGPPGCGKTFFAEKLAEEIGFNFHKINPSDIQSKWVNASQENIKKLFDEAKENAPSIIFIDEIDALVPDRNNSKVSHMNTSAVNEFLAQMNNCGEEGIFIIGATNRPQAIDPAILRAGRLDKVIYLPPPDFEARKLMFELHLKNRPKDIGLDYDKLATLTDKFVSSDLKFLCDEASRNALNFDVRISMKILIETIQNNNSSLSIAELKKYEAHRAQIEGNSTTTNNRRQIGFNKN